MKRKSVSILILCILLAVCMNAGADNTAQDKKNLENAAKTVLAPLAESFEDTEAIPIISILRRAGAEVTVASLGELTVTSAQGLKVIADRKINDCANDKFDLIVLHGGMPAAKYLHDSDILKRLLIEQNRQGKLYAAICASPVVVLNAHGLLDGKRATSYPSMAEKLSDNSAAGERVVTDKNCITSQGPGTSMEFALTLVEALYGKEKAAKLKKGYLVK